MSAAAFFTIKCVTAHEHSELEEVVNTTSLLKRLVHAFAVTRDAKVCLEFFIQRWEIRECLGEAFLGAFHSAVIPNHLAQFAVEVVRRLCSTRCQVTVEAQTSSFFSSLELWVISSGNGLIQHWSQVVADCVRQYEVSV